jgi:small-conductance mechanosensitive channel
MIEVLTNPYIALLVRVILAIALVAILLVVAHYSSRFIALRVLNLPIMDDAYTNKASKLLRDVIFMVMALLALLLWFQLVGLNFALLVWWITMGITLGCTELLKNMIAGILVMTNPQYKIGDFIYFISPNHRVYRWKLFAVTLKHSILKGLDRRRILIPNIQMITRPLIVYWETGLVRIEAEFYLPYHSHDIQTMLERVREGVNSLEWTREKESTRVMITEFTKKGFHCTVYVYFYRKELSIIVARAELKKTVYQSISKHGVDMPYPHVKVHLMFDDQHLIQSIEYVKQALNTWFSSKNVARTSK